jgi:hypothetical protein
VFSSRVRIIVNWARDQEVNVTPTQDLVLNFPNPRLSRFFFQYLLVETILDIRLRVPNRLNSGEPCRRRSFLSNDRSV